MPSKVKKQKRVVGDVVRIDLGDGTHTYARVLGDAAFAFYDRRVKEELPTARIIGSSILFQIPVMHYAVKKGLWAVVGNEPLDESLMNPPPFFMQDAFNKEVFSIYERGQIRPATKAECTGLERAAVWDPEHVVDRIRDHYAGRENAWVISLRIKD